MVIAVMLLSGCSNFSDEIKRIVVISDTHLFDAERLLVENGKAFREQEGSNDVMMVESKDILDELFRRIDSLKPQVVLIPGDLSNNGERINHELVNSRYILPLQKKGIKVYVIPGNHDINNPHAKLFKGSRAEDTPSITADEFAQIYRTSGYSNAISRDSASLSYSVSLSHNLGLIALDVANYEPGMTEQERLSGSVKPQTLKWMEHQINLFQSKGREIIVMMHHSAFEHWKDENLYMPGFVVDNSEELVKLLLKKNVKFVFSGHFHAQDIAQYGGKGGEPLYDISTGSAVSTASPIRIVDFGPNNEMTITYEDLSGWNKVVDGLPLRDYADQRVYDWVRHYISAYGIPEEYVEEFVKLGGDAFIANYLGDEKLPEERRQLLEKIAETNEDYLPLIYGFMIEGLYTDTYPQDNNITFNMLTGEIIR